MSTGYNNIKLNASSGRDSLDDELQSNRRKLHLLLHLEEKLGLSRLHGVRRQQRREGLPLYRASAMALPFLDGSTTFPSSRSRSRPRPRASQGATAQSSPSVSGCRLMPRRRYHLSGGHQEVLLLRSPTGHVCRPCRKSHSITGAHPHQPRHSPRRRRAPPIRPPRRPHVGRHHGPRATRTGALPSALGTVTAVHLFSARRVDLTSDTIVVRRPQATLPGPDPFASRAGAHGRASPVVGSRWRS